MKQIPIVYASDNNGINQITVSVYSLLKNKKPETNYEIYVFSKDFAEASQVDLETIVNSYPGSTIQFIDCKEYEKRFDLSGIEMRDEGLRNIKWPSPTYYRLLTPLILKDKERAIYLDIDTLVLSDLTELFEQQFNGYAAGAINHPVAGWIKWMNECIRNNTMEERWIYKHFNSGTTEYDIYIQAGMFLFNIPMWKDVDFDKLFALAHEKNFNDEDLINYSFKGQLHVLPNKYNYCVHFVNDTNYKNFPEYFGKPIEKFDEELNQAQIIHFSARGIKPDYIVNQSTIYLMSETGDFDKFMNLLEDYEMFSMIYDMKKSPQYAQRMKVLADTYQKIVQQSSKSGVYSKLFRKWFLYAYEILNKYGIKA